MQFRQKIEEMEVALRAKGKSVEDLRLVAGIARSTWTRWKSGRTSPNYATLTKVEDAYSSLLNGDVEEGGVVA